MDLEPVSYVIDRKRFWHMISASNFEQWHRDVHFAMKYLGVDQWLHKDVPCDIMDSGAGWEKGKVLAYAIIKWTIDSVYFHKMVSCGMDDKDMNPYKTLQFLRRRHGSAASMPSTPRTNGKV